MKKDLLPRILKEPLLHFFVVGSVLFAILNSDEQNKANLAATSIEVSQDALIRYLEFRAKVIEPDSFAGKLNSLSEDELQALIDNFIREEVLFREAKNLGLDKEDFGARRRLIQQLEFINQGVVSSAIQLSEDDLKAFLDLNKERYLEPATVTFTHVFSNAQLHGADGADEKARDLLSELNGDSPVPFHEAARHGDRFLFNQNYVAKDATEIASHFGAGLQIQLFELEPSENRWQGPFRSSYGSHPILLIKKTKSRLPDFESLKKRLEEDAFQSRLEEELFRLEKSVVDQYSIRLEPDLEQRLLSRSEQ